MRTTGSSLLAATLAAHPPATSTSPISTTPGIDELEDNPTPSGVAAACTGLLIGNRAQPRRRQRLRRAARHPRPRSLQLRRADPRYVGELLQGTLNAGSPFGGNFWALPYANIRLANTILHAIDKVAEFATRTGRRIRGLHEDDQALDLLEVIDARDDVGAVIETDHPIDGPLGADRQQGRRARGDCGLLDEAQTDLDSAAGKAFPFQLSSGFAGFDTPASFLKFNRAIRARVAVYQKDYAGRSLRSASRSSTTPAIR